MVDITFRGTYDHTIDEKGRLSFPSKIRETLRLYDSEMLIALPWFGEHVRVYPQSQWDNLQKKLTADTDLSAKNRGGIIRYLMANSNDFTLDKQGRMLVSPTMRNAVKLNKDVVLLGVNDHVEIWDKAEWTEECDSGQFSAEAVQETLQQLKIF